MIIGLDIFILSLVLFAVIFAVVFFLIGLRRLRDLRQLYQQALASDEPATLENILLAQAGLINTLARRIDALEQSTSEEKRAAKGYMQRCVLDRYRAFKDVGGDQSFSLALLDGSGNGFILTSLYGREESRIYAKRVAGGQATQALSEEERKVLLAAWEKNGDRKQDTQPMTAKL